MSKAELYKSIHKNLTVFWALHIPAVLLLYFFAHRVWVEISILYLALVSIYANAATHFGAYQGSRAEIQAKKVTTKEVNTKELNVKGKK